MSNIMTLTPKPDRCDCCGDPLTLEMERDDGVCVNCQAEAARICDMSMMMDVYHGGIA